MITAKEALALATRDEVAVENLLKQLDPLIRAAATAGKRSYEIKAVGWTACEMFWMERTAANAKTELAMNALKKLGYSANWGPVGTPYVPASMRDDYDGSGPMCCNLAITIRW